VVAIPTETVYGLAANAFNPEAVAKIYDIKQRPPFNPLIIHSDTLEKFESWGLQIPAAAKMLAAKFSPGPLTYVTKKHERIPGVTTAGSPGVAIRIPRHPLTLELLRLLDFPVAAPSANISGSISPTTAAHVAGQLHHAVPYILDGGPCAVGLESTIVSFLEDVPRILRYGGIGKEAIEAALGMHVNDPVEAKDESGIIAPGMMLRHYAPKHRLHIGNPADFTGEYDPSRIAVLSFHNRYDKIPAANQFVLSAAGNLEEAARHLFSAMQEADQLNIDIIVAEVFPDAGIGRAINDRLRRASDKNA
jgi:L-threonylcarbamoyladenylate synthase